MYGMLSIEDQTDCGDTGAATIDRNPSSLLQETCSTKIMVARTHFENKRPHPRQNATKCDITREAFYPERSREQPLQNLKQSKRALKCRASHQKRREYHAPLCVWACALKYHKLCRSRVRLQQRQAQHGMRL